jgi:hypothetical protein
LEPEGLTETGLILARLDEIEPNGRLLNRPARSLRQIFPPWSPQTYATVAERSRALDRTIQRHPTVAWNTLLGLAPRLNDSSQPSPLPVWRNFTLDAPMITACRDVHDAAVYIGERLLEPVGENPILWKALLGHWANFDKAWREAAKARLMMIAESFQGEDRADFREALRDFLHKHESFAEAFWALPAEDLATLSVIFDRLEPTGAVARNAWLFKSGPALRQRERPWKEARQ